MIAELTVTAPAPLLTLNRERTLHWAKRAVVVKLWRDAANVLARAAKLPQFDRADVVFEIHQAKGLLADATAHHPVTKAVLDGLIDAGVLVDDDPAHVLSITERAPIRAEGDAVVVTVKGILAKPNRNRRSRWPL